MNKEEISKRIDEVLQILKQEPSFIFNLEEIGAIQYLQNEIIDIQKDINFHLDKENIISKEELKAKQTILNLISKLQKEIKHNNFLYIKEKNKNEKLLICYNDQKKELDKKDKVIDLIITDYLNLSKERMSKEEFKKWYFDLVGIKKVEEENE